MSKIRNGHAAGWLIVALLHACSHAAVHPSQAPAGAEASAGESGAAGEAAGGAGASAASGQGGSAGRAMAGASGNSAGQAGSAGRAGPRAGDGAAGAAASAAAIGGSGGQAGTEFFGASRCANAGLLLCDGFESGTLDSSLWKTKFTAPTFDAQRAARGNKSLHFSTSATGASGIETSAIFPAAKDTYYGRIFIYFDALPSSPQWAHWTVVGANPTQASTLKGEIRVGGQFDGKLERFGVGTDGGATGDWTTLDDDPAGKPGPVPEKRWTCLEWMHDALHDETRLYIDGVEHPSLHTTADMHGGSASAQYALPDFGSVWVGFWNYDQGKTVVPSKFDVWIDEVALDDTRIGCTQ